MPMYDRRCQACGQEKLDCWEPIQYADPECSCGGSMQRAWIGKPNGVIGDEIDVTIEHGLCHKDGTPRRFRSRAELRRAEEAANYTNYVVHQGSRGSDKSKHTTRWI